MDQARSTISKIVSIVFQPKIIKMINFISLIITPTTPITTVKMSGV